MYRRILVKTFQRSLVALVLLCLGCSAQSSAPADLDRRIERQIRSQFQLPEQVKVAIGPRTSSSDFPGYDKVTITLSAGDHKQDVEFLLAKDSKTLVRISKMDLTRDPYEEIMRKIDISGRPWKGNKDAKVVIVNYDDFQCPFCSRMHQALFTDVFKDYAGVVKIIYKDFPLYQIHPWASRAAIDSNCLADQNNDAYWAFADYLHANGAQISGDQQSQKPLPQQMDAVDGAAREMTQKFNLDKDKLNACLKAQDDSKIRASVKEGEALGVQATPTLFINGSKIDGAVPPQQLRAAIDRALSDAGQAVPKTAAAAQ
jgi:protein-disulfide isomerase